MTIAMSPEGANTARVPLTHTAGSGRYGDRSRGLPAPLATTQGVVMIPADQTYFWSQTWQDFERQADQDIDAGDVVTFDDPAEVLRWLMTEDD